MQNLVCNSYDHADGVKLRAAYNQLLACYGEQQWWPADTSFEVMLGAVLVQSTAWTNAETALANLKQAELLSPQSLLAVDEQQLAERIRSAGYQRVKAKRLRNLCQMLVAAGGLEKLRVLDTEALRARLLGVNGIGNETADVILVYAFQRSVFVVDAYARRWLSRMGWVTGKESYQCLRLDCEAGFAGTTQEYNEYHALIVAHAKAACRKQARCGNCCFQHSCRYCNESVHAEDHFTRPGVNGKLRG